MKEKNIQITGISETHWLSETEELFQHNGLAVFHSGRSDGVQGQGVAFVIESVLANHISSYDLISERLIGITIKLAKEVVTTMQVYAPDTSYPDETVDDFYQILEILERNQNSSLWATSMRK